MVRPAILGEDAAGEWTLRIKDLSRGDTGALRSWGLTIYGHGSVPGAPEIDTVTPGGGTLEIDWNAPTDTGETAITSYDLRYIRDDATDRSDGNWSVETGVGTPSNRSYTITGLTGGVKYEIQLRAHNDSGHGPWSQAEAEEPTTVKPAAPAITSITRGDRTLAVVWTAPADTGGGVITAYDVRYIETSEDETDGRQLDSAGQRLEKRRPAICHLKSHKRDGVRRTGAGRQLRGGWRMV